MIVVGVTQAKKRFPELVEPSLAGEDVAISRYKKIVARLVQMMSRSQISPIHIVQWVEGQPRRAKGVPLWALEDNPKTDIHGR